MASSSEPKNEQEIIARFQEMRQQVAETISKIADLEAEAAEHELVIKTLRPMETDRKCYRLVGDVLVQRTVAETLPAVERNKAGLDDILSKLRQQQERMQKQLEEFQARYKIRLQGQEGGGPRGGGGGGSGSGGAGSSSSSSSSAQKPSGSKPSGASQGVLVS